MRIVSLIPILFLYWGVMTEPLSAQRIVVYPEKNTLCLASKIRGKNYLLEDGDVIYRRKKIAKTQNGCFTLPKNYCSVGVTQGMVFHPYSLYRYFNKKINFILTGKKVWSRRGNTRQEVIFCFPVGKSSYRGDSFTIVVNEYSELLRLKMAVPYVANVKVNDKVLLGTIKPFVNECDTKDITCLVYNSYTAVVRNLSYKSDPYNGGRDYIRTPRETIKNKGGDCEDLTGVLVSFLANLNVDSYVLMTRDHAYAMACGVNPDRLREYIRSGLNKSITKTERKILRYGRIEAFSFGLSGAKRGGKMRWHFSLKGRNPFSFIVVSGKVSSSALKARNFSYYKECSGINITEFTSSCELGANISIIVSYGAPLPGVNPPSNLSRKNNPNNPIDLKIKGDYNLADFNQIAVHYYPLKKNGQDNYCVVLEPTTGVQGYPGFSRVKNQWSIAVSPVNWEWFYLKTPKAIYQ